MMMFERVLRGAGPGLQLPANPGRPLQVPAPVALYVCTLQSPLCLRMCPARCALCIATPSPTLTTLIVLRSAVSLRRHRDCSGSPLAAPISCDSGRCARCVRGGSPRPAEWGTCELFSVASPSMRRTASSNGMSRAASHHSLRAGVGYVLYHRQCNRNAASVVRALTTRFLVGVARGHGLWCPLARRPISRSASKRRLRRSAVRVTCLCKQSAHPEHGNNKRCVWAQHSQSMHSMTHMPALAPAPTSPKARVSVASSYVPWSPIHRAPKGKWNASKAPDPRPEYLSNDACT